jgi:purine-binding chemotaxis protein CheW
VDKIDKVIGINSESIQPPHPIFGDINIKFISGVVEKQGALYIILDVIRMFTQSEEDKQKPRGVISDRGSENYFTPEAGETTPDQKAAVSDTALAFIKESLPTLIRFYPGDLNDEWVRRRFADWSGTRSGEALQLKSIEEAEEYLSGFYSPDTGRFWDEDYCALVKGVLPNLSSNNINVWNIGCGKGYEAFSFMCILKSRYPNGRIKIWANDSDVMAISQAPNMIFDLEDLPEYCRPYTAWGRNGYSFKQEIKDSIVFEYHDVLNANSLPDLDIILIRDVLSFLKVQDQKKIIDSFSEMLKSKGLVIVGRNEIMPGGSWDFIGKEPVSAYAHKE